jgi:UTP--glucose-1-phosphate uridylyltransferase
MEYENLPKIVIDTFEYYYNQLLNGETGYLPEDRIISIDDLPSFEGLVDELAKIGKDNLSKSVIIKLNGGLGTSMGLSEAKSLLKVKSGLTFLDIIAKQSEISKIPLVLMNSFSTQEKSLELMNNYKGLTNYLPLDFLQHKIPKINCKSFLPAEYPQNPEMEWCPPGHGDIYTALVTSGMLDKLLGNNIKYAFISNSDNLGAVMDYKILGYFAKNNFPFLIEAANRTEADKKGGHLARLKNGKLILRESAQCRNEDEKEFQNVSKHKYFNTNNIWINLKALKQIMIQKNNILGLPMIVNQKTVDPRDPKSESVFQLETAMGSAILVFDNASALHVPRSRFAPVKTTDDLLAVRSDNYILTDDFRVVENPKRTLDPLVVSLDKKYYKLVDDLDKRIPNAPSLVDCEKLTIEGDYKVGNKVKFVGKVTLKNDSEIQKLVMENSILEI